MQRYGGYISEGLRYRVDVPTTIFEDRVAVIKAYKGRGTNKIASVHVPLKNMPYWDVKRQAIMLQREDMTAIIRAGSRLAKKLAGN